MNLKSTRFISIFLSVAVFALALGARLYRIDNSSIWMDEDAQAHHILKGPFDFSLVERAAKQHQPPLDYFVEGLFLRLFGITELGARFHAALFGALACLLIFLILLSLFKRPVLAALLSILPMIDPSLIYYSKEGRPISCGVCFSCLYLLVVCHWLLASAKLKQHIRFAGFYFLATVLLLLSVGFQPIVLVIVVSFSSLPLLFLRGERMKVVLILTLSVVAFFIVLPVLRLAIEQGAKHVGELSLFERLQSLRKGLEYVTLSSWTTKYSLILRHNLPFAALSVVGGLYCLYRTRGKLRRRTAGTFVFVLLLSILLYPAIFDILYYSQIHRKIQFRYYLSFSVPVLITVLALAGMGFTVVGKFLEKRGTGRKLLPHVGLILFLGCSVVMNLDNLKTQFVTQKNTDWKSLYHLLDTQGNRGDVAFMMNLVAQGKWQPFFYARQFYYSKDRRPPVRLKSISSLKRYYDSNRLDRISQLFFVTAYGHKYLTESSIEKVKGAEFVKFNKLTVIRLRKTSDMKENVHDLFQYLAIGTKRSRKTHTIFEIHDMLSERQDPLTSQR